mmetsp:Transcript_64972/g.174443  ORF Transcript_64972/g.174443 Transcript_64972/m.174443 type:complete len:274 (-) Transcript_64972:180-1001(-)
MSHDPGNEKTQSRTSTCLGRVLPPGVPPGPGEGTPTPPLNNGNNVVDGSPPACAGASSASSNPSSSTLDCLRCLIEFLPASKVESTAAPVEWLTRWPVASLPRNRGSAAAQIPAKPATWCTPPASTLRFKASSRTPASTRSGSTLAEPPELVRASGGDSRPSLPDVCCPRVTGVHLPNPSPRATPPASVSRSTYGLPARMLATAELKTNRLCQRSGARAGPLGLNPTTNISRSTTASTFHQRDFITGSEGSPANPRFDFEPPLPLSAAPNLSE